jgi:hypothetical protein
MDGLCADWLSDVEECVGLLAGGLGLAAGREVGEGAGGGAALEAEGALGGGGGEADCEFESGIVGVVGKRAVVRVRACVRVCVCVRVCL